MTFKFISINIAQGGEFHQELVHFLAEQKADIVVMQEVYAGEDPTLPINYRSLELLEQLGYAYHAFEPAFIDHREVGVVMQGNAVYSKFPIESSRAVFYDVPFGHRPEHTAEYFPITPRNLQHVVIQAHGIALNVFNTQGIWGTHGGDTDRRIEMAKTILREVDRKSHVILAGDFNFNPGTQAMNLIDAKLQDVFKGTLVSTFNMRQKTNPGFATAIVDMVFVSREFRVLEQSCPDVNISDHLPLIVTLEIVKTA